MGEDDQVCEPLAEGVPEDLDDLGLALVDVVKLSENKRLTLDDWLGILLT